MLRKPGRDQLQRQIVRSTSKKLSCITTQRTLTPTMHSGFHVPQP